MWWNNVAVAGRDKCNLIIIASIGIAYTSEVSTNFALDTTVYANVTFFCIVFSSATIFLPLREIWNIAGKSDHHIDRCSIWLSLQKKVGKLAGWLMGHKKLLFIKLRRNCAITFATAEPNLRQSHVKQTLVTSTGSIKQSSNRTEPTWTGVMRTISTLNITILTNDWLNTNKVVNWVKPHDGRSAMLV